MPQIRYYGEKKPPLPWVLIILGIIIFSAFIFMTFEWEIDIINEPDYDWSSEKVAIVNYRILGTREANDQVTVKNNEKFTILIQDFLVNGVELTENKQYVLSPGQSVTFMGAIGGGRAGEEYKYTVSILYDDYDNDVVGYLFSPRAKLIGTFE